MTNPHISYRESSRKNWGTRSQQLSDNQVQLGALLRLADAAEKANEDRQKLEDGYRYMRQDRDQYRELYETELRRSASYKGHMNRLRRRAEELTTMIKVFRACIKTRVLPQENSPCHKEITDLIGE